MAEVLAPGAFVGGYRIERRLGSGGMGQVFLAHHPRLPRRDALKVLGAQQSRDQEYRTRFVREAEVAGRLDHPNLVPVYDYGTDNGLLWMAMRFVDGYSAADLIRRSGRLAPEQAVAIIAAAAQGLDAVHEAGLLHRDVKPANILIAADGHVMVTDFGIARVSGADTGLTAAGSVLATLAYAAPEQLSGAALDHRVDVYALGATLYQLLTGTVPFPRETAAAVMRAHLMDRPPRPSRIATTLSKQMDAVIARAMDKDPARRFPTCGELAAAAHPALARPAAAVRRRRARVSIAVGGVLAAIGSALFLMPDREMPPPIVEETSTPLTSTTPVSPWGTYQFIIDAFPALLPATPGGVGHQNLNCAPGNPQTSTAPLDTVADRYMLVCNGDNNPVTQMLILCNADRTRGANPQTAEGTESWTRPSGSGQAWWGPSPLTHAPGQLDLRFDDDGRKFCAVQVFATMTGRELFDRWLPSAPL
ncbi:serine/threonine-protein kinase [Nocardia sp. NPDC050406]|uniref:serine/threonine-protein kinase n=1 Tax=Nocardia sp. NPDC050406 TaxID=3364318 RepID=UPI0037B0E8C1